MKLPQTGGCQCGTLRYEITQAPQLVYACHCTACQRMTSSAFSMAIVLPAENFHLLAGEPQAFQRTGTSGRVLTLWICPKCGSWICAGPNLSAVRNVRAGTLDDTVWLRPTVHFWTCNKQPWVMLPEGSESFETQPADLPHSCTRGQPNHHYVTIKLSYYPTAQFSRRPVTRQFP